jgi:hypothetical protein
VTNFHYNNEDNIKNLGAPILADPQILQVAYLLRNDRTSRSPNVLNVYAKIFLYIFIYLKLS